MDVLVSFKTCLKSFDARKWWSCCNKLQVCRDIYNTTLPPIIMEWSGKMGLWKMSLVRSTAPDQPAIAVLALAHLKMKISDLRFEILYANRDHDIIWICISPYNIYIYTHVYIHIYLGNSLQFYGIPAWNDGNLFSLANLWYPSSKVTGWMGLLLLLSAILRSEDVHTHILYYVILYYIILYYIILYMIYMRIYT